MLLKDLLGLTGYKYMTAVSKNVYFDELNNVVDKYKNTYHNTTKMKPTDVKSNSFTEYNTVLILMLKILTLK